MLDAIEAARIEPGQNLIYDDGRHGHRNVSATVHSVSDRGMVVQFDDRADTTFIRFTDRAWMDHLRLA